LILPAGCRAAFHSPVDLHPALGDAVLLGAGGTRGDWERWGQAHLQDGDVLFVLGRHRILLGLVDFSQVSREVAGSRFSHVALVSCEDGPPLVYDTVQGGPRRIPFARFMRDRRVEQVAVKRLRGEYQSHVPQAVAYCRDVYRRRVPFDEQLRLDNDGLYCSELVELAYRAAGLPLSEPVRIDRLPHFDQLSPATVRVIETATGLRPDQAVYVPGNEELGIWSNPRLELVLDATHADSPPECP
jgi:hypothetical protein